MCWIIIQLHANEFDQILACVKIIENSQINGKCNQSMCATVVQLNWSKWRSHTGLLLHSSRNSSDTFHVSKNLCSCYSRNCTFVLVWRLSPPPRPSTLPLCEGGAECCVGRSISFSSELWLTCESSCCKPVSHEPVKPAAPPHPPNPFPSPTHCYRCHPFRC